MRHYAQGTHVALVLELMKGASLLDYVLDKGGYSEQDAVSEGQWCKLNTSP